MDCAATRRLMYAYLDSELDLASAAALQSHLEECPQCGRLYDEQLTIRRALSGSGGLNTPPPALRRRIRAAIRKEAMKSYPGPAPVWQWVGAAAAVSAALILIVLVARNAFVPSADELIADELIQSHVRSLMLNHLTDVTSTDQHTVKPWFNGKIDFSPDVRDFTADGYPLAGGRLDYVGGEPASVLVYRRHSHVINLFITRGEKTVRTRSRQGFNIVSWQEEGMRFCAVSDLNVEELRAFEELVRK